MDLWNAVSGLQCGDLRPGMEVNSLQYSKSSREHLLAVGIWKTSVLRYLCSDQMRASRQDSRPRHITCC